MAHRIALLVAGAAAAIASAVGTNASAAEELRTVVPQPHESPPRVDPLLTMTGAVLFGIPYAGSVAVATVSDHDADKWLYWPVFGPMADLVHRNACTTWGCHGSDLGSVALPLVLSSVGQAAGMSIFIVSLARPSKPAPAPARKAGVTLRVLPTASPGGAGVTAIGTF
jgi:hypothetical protein